MKSSELDYSLPPELIAQKPAYPRDAARLLVLERSSGRILHRAFRNLGDFLRAGDLLVCNRSRVIRARLMGKKVPTGGRVEVMLLRKDEESTWEVLTRGRRVRVGLELAFGEDDGALRGKLAGRTQAGSWLMEFSEPLEARLAALGQMPLPPYIHEPLDDGERYQTVYAQDDGSVAAPTAGLHFTLDLMEELEGRGVEFAFLTLHIGWDTFRPIREEYLSQHVMHSEYCHIPEDVAERLNRALAEGRRTVAVGTSSVRALETAAREEAGGVKVIPFSGWTSLFIYPGRRFRAVDALLTNFHLPRSTLLALVYAFAGKELIDRAYQEAIRRRYRFYSFGDAMLIV